MNTKARIEQLERRSAVSGGPQLDFSGLTRDERGELKTILEAVTAGTMTADDAAAEVARLGIGKR